MSSEVGLSDTSLMSVKGRPLYLRVFKRPAVRFVENPIDLSYGQARFDFVNEKTASPNPYEKGPFEYWDKNSKKLGERTRKYNAFLAELEVYYLDHFGKYKLYKTFTVTSYTGTLGPKTRQGDGQLPEGFYEVIEKSLRTHGEHGKNFDIGYPNRYDQFNKRTGSKIEVHATRQSDGCLAMDADMDEVYELVRAAFAKGQKSIPIHIFPFPLTNENLARYKEQAPEFKKISDLPDPLTKEDLLQFWGELKPAYEYFEQNQRPPCILQGREYLINDCPETKKMRSSEFNNQNNAECIRP